MTKKINILLFLFTVVFFTACNKCYTCLPLVSDYLFTKQSDSIYFSCGHINLAIDTLNKYKQLGYKCDTLFYGYGNGTLRCSNDALHSAEALGDSCFNK